MPLENRNVRELANIFRADGDWKYIVYDALNDRGRTLKDVLSKVGTTYQHWNITLKTDGINGYKLVSRILDELGFELILWVQVRSKRKWRKERPVVKINPNSYGEESRRSDH